uniref:Maltose/galactoside acetyltransferase domain-containing protein n=1 Tax=Chromera velia CCMP2878 TaxID=1169474 RepID=A0A0G4FHI1_9ALVE|mmetsp:Transcript_42482/g.83749  ORF Transcript_42482/g.83749 Transcript_42482/m.83749 type:complete len:246 (+) Transcript_42482:174-911(+)|eukprot:Cvel_16954.t1-p1 / transcript=Cvel_16954.t1 / gene=Cvel_16954 / organism=Chromera_velia_CCMP2878 / gene_product=Maltose O-acetyltransferase, putative / transcript_product=Maltose O-acetyltransferase, putative / location=Cvel_scaffold1330:11912-15681(+) / protein_length=245 / sequence_SO=supercontig / SO=protein_coding / is_pseudo=false
MGDSKETEVKRDLASGMKRREKFECEEMIKMISGVPYRANVPQLEAGRREAFALTEFFNRMPVRQAEKSSPLVSGSESPLTLSLSFSSPAEIKEAEDVMKEERGEREMILGSLFGGMGEGVEIVPPFRCDYGFNTFLGDRVYLNYDCIFLDVAPIRVGDGTKFGPGVHLYTAGHIIDPSRRADLEEFGKEIRIGSNVWVGGRVVVLPGVTIGDNSVIGAGSVVTKDVPSNVIAVGSPCKVVKEIR